ncbi:hypothetical protein GA0061102_101127 [Rhizobium miluonense]|uniref:Uncharacterized protein n=1 Tax=Rhizobium miluonense TaxID=411945 RepID=A0A1C3VBZ5_9HYPH|nr:hypothetical protein GA0061102_101127 [Rhizobium miluonense]
MIVAGCQVTKSDETAVRVAEKDREECLVLLHGWRRSASDLSSSRQAASAALMSL